MRVLRIFLFVSCLIIGICAGAKEYNCFWQAAKHADEIGIIKSQNRGNDLKLTRFLSGKKSDVKIKYPDWLVWQVRTTGEYLLPLTKKDANYVICGQKYSIPAIKADDAAKYDEIIKQYKKLKPEEEDAFFKKVIRNENYASLALPCLYRLNGIGEFSRVMPKKDCNFWLAVYSQKNIDISFKRYLLYNISRSNFLNSIAIFEAALKDTKLSTMAGQIFAEKDKKRFEKLMTSWLADDKLRLLALMNSQNMIENPAYVSAAMKYFDPKDKKELIYFIPVLCAASNKKAQDFIKTFLTCDQLPKSQGHRASTVITSMPGAPLLAFTRFQARIIFSRSTITSIRYFVPG
ncbi:MAG: hypothetical protein PHV82_14310 [Victivallaceae bacterium]|nr:hypothetical protein [Victivallaceae bacterium]